MQDQFIRLKCITYLLETVPAFKSHNIKTLPTFEVHNVGILLLAAMSRSSFFRSSLPFGVDTFVQGNVLIARTEYSVGENHFGENHFLTE